MYLALPVNAKVKYMERVGIWCVGNILVDNIKVISDWPVPETLVLVEKTQLSPGGGAVNVALDLARAIPGFPLYLGGKIGTDYFGDFLLDYFKKYPINLQSVVRTNKAETAWTDVMTEKSTGKRTFFHHTGAADFYASADIMPFASINAKIFYFAYPSLLKALDTPDDDYGCKAGRIFYELKKQGFMIAMDCVSAAAPDFFQNRILPALQNVDILILNEYETQLATNMVIDIKNKNILSQALGYLAQKGPATVVIHYPKGAAVYHNRQISFHHSYKVNQNEIKGSVGAGDAFSAGLLYGIHEGWDINKSINLASAMARFNLTDLSATEGIKRLTEIQNWQKTAPKYLPE